MIPSEVIRAAVESVAENTVDGIIAPLFFAALGGPVAAMAYKAVNTLDSMIGYKSERYLDFGQTAAKIDDGANYLPARIAAPILTAAAALLGFRTSAAWRIANRDGRKHQSPNAGIAEAAFAGALGARRPARDRRSGRAARARAHSCGEPPDVHGHGDRRDDLPRGKMGVFVDPGDRVETEKNGGGVRVKRGGVEL